MGFSENNVTFKATFGEVYKVGDGGGAVSSVNGKTGDVLLNASDIGAYTKEETDNKLSGKADKSELSKIPVKISELVDDTGQRPITRAGNCDCADFSEIANKDQKGNIIHETYSTREEVGNINNAIDLIEAIQNQLIGGASE